MTDIRQIYRLLVLDGPILPAMLPRVNLQNQVTLLLPPCTHVSNDNNLSFICIGKKKKEKEKEIEKKQAVWKFKN